MNIDRQMGIVLKHLEDLGSRAAKTGMSHSAFLTPAEQALAKQHFARYREAALVFEGGISNAQRQVAVFLANDWGKYEAEEILQGFRIDYRNGEAIGHRDILGTMMAQGIEREVLGDILAGESPAYVICLASMAAYLQDNIAKIGGAGVSLTPVKLADIPLREEKLKSKTVTAASLRLDALVGEGFNLSRSEAARLIQSGLVALNHLPCEKPDQKLAAGDLLSLRGKGRIKILEIGGQSKKGRLFVELGIYQ
ncbi:MAG: YlmH/Sll1252 family protein [Clostridiales bacterium]